MVNIPVDDQNAFHLRVGSEERSSSHGNGVEVAEPHGLLNLSVMARWAHQSKPIGNFALCHSSSQGENATRGNSRSTRCMRLVPNCIRVDSNALTGQSAELHTAQQLRVDLVTVDCTGAVQDCEGL